MQENAHRTHDLKEVCYNENRQLFPVRIEPIMLQTGNNGQKILGGDKNESTVLNRPRYWCCICRLGLYDTRF